MITGSTAKISGQTRAGPMFTSNELIRITQYTLINNDSAEPMTTNAALPLNSCTPPASMTPPQMIVMIATIVHSVPRPDTCPP